VASLTRAAPRRTAGAGSIGIAPAEPGGAGQGLLGRHRARPRDGLSLLEQKSAALALIDLHMPDMDGLKLLRNLRRRNANVTVLMLSGDDEPRLPPRVIAQGAKAFVPKATPPNLLLRAVRQARAVGAFGPRKGSAEPLNRRRLPVPRSAGRTLPVPSRPPPTQSM